MNGLVCPKCSTEMSFFTFFKTLTPWHFKCSECKAKLRIKKYRSASIIAAFLIGMFIGSVLAILGIILITMDNRFFDDYFPLYLLFCIVVALLVAFFYEVMYYKLAKKFDLGFETR